MKTAHLGTSTEAINAAAVVLGVIFPEALEEVWRISNGLELPGGWTLFPVFDASSARKTSNNIVYENTKGRWPYMPEDLVAIAGGMTGNCLVLQRFAGVLDPQIFLWDHETNTVRCWSRSLEYIKERALARVAKVEKEIARSKRSEA
ncbi:MAG: SMI1/KNR4 family protein [Candidatus Hydrogenedentes bacterium]|nr:SMI1/KNR4 family protein [Candidatus Hydrogenedentota bacterium]